jgi:hypothetical protein
MVVVVAVVVVAKVVVVLDRVEVAVVVVAEVVVDVTDVIVVVIEVTVVVMEADVKVVHGFWLRVWVIACRLVHSHPIEASHPSAVASRWSCPPQLVPSVCCGVHSPHTYV